MVRHHVAQRAGAVIVTAAFLYAHALGCGDLHMVDITAIPDRLEDAVGETEDQDILHGLFAEIMVDAVDLALGEDRADFLIERTSGVEVVAERFLDNDPPPLTVVLVHEPGCPELL